MKQFFRRWLNPGDDIESARRHCIVWILVVTIFLAGCWVLFHPFRKGDELLVVSYDATREYFSAINQAFGRLEDPQNPAAVVMSHAGSVRQARNVSRGLEADILHFASWMEMELALPGSASAEDWRLRFPHASSPYQSTIVFIVRKGNPRGIRDWDDLFEQKLRISSPDPRISGAGRFAYLGSVAMALRRTGSGSLELLDPAWQELVSLYSRVDLIPFGARQALDVFRRNEKADVFLTWESEALWLAGTGDPELEMVVPSRSILAESVVALVDSHVDSRGSREAAIRYLDFLFSPEGQAIAARNGFRPAGNAAAGPQFPVLELFPVEALGPEGQVRDAHFAENGFLDALLKARIARRGGVE